MTYTDLANVYVGDVSSQVYEFLRPPRPCLFLNTYRVEHAGKANYAHWAAGPVIDDLRQLEFALRFAIDAHADIYRPVQQRLFDYSFDLSDEPSSYRAARAIAGVLGEVMEPSALLEERAFA